MANNPQITVSITPSIVTTTDGSSTVTILSVPFHNTTGGQALTFDVVGYDFSNNDIATAKITAKVKNVSGTLTMVGTPVHLVPISAGSSSNLTTAVLDIIVSGSNVELNVIGVTGRTIKWAAYVNPGVEVLNSWTAVPAPEDGYVQIWSGSNTRWEPVSVTSAFNGVTVGGDLSGTLPNPDVINIHGASVPVAGSLTTGNVLQVTGSSALSYGPINLAGGSNYITGTLPAGNQAAQTLSGDVTGTTAATKVETITGVVSSGSDVVYAGDSTHSFILKKTTPTGAGAYDMTIEAASGSGGGGTIHIIPGDGGLGVDGSIVLGMNGSGVRQCAEIQIDTAKINLINPNTGTTATGGSATALPSFPVGYLIINFGELQHRIPYYNA